MENAYRVNCTQPQINGGGGKKSNQPTLKVLNSVDLSIMKTEFFFSYWSQDQGVLFSTKFPTGNEHSVICVVFFISVVNSVELAILVSAASFSLNVD